MIQGMKCAFGATLTACMLIATPLSAQNADRAERGRSAASELREDMGQRVRSAASEFREAVRNRPNQSARAVAYLTNSMGVREVQARVPRGLAIRGFRHGSEINSGGYTLAPGESVDDAVASYERDHSLFLAVRSEQMRSLLEAEPGDEGMATAVQEGLRLNQQREDDFYQHGLRIIGVELEGRLRDMEQFRSSNGFVRVIELRDENKARPAILPNR